MAENLRSYLAFATETAYLAGQLTLGYFQTGILPEFKGDDTPVTVADKKCEAFMLLTLVVIPVMYFAVYRRQHLSR